MLAGTVQVLTEYEPLLALVGSFDELRDLMEEMQATTCAVPHCTVLPRGHSILIGRCMTL